MTGGEQELRIPYAPFADARNSDPARFPDYIRPHLDLSRIAQVPAAIDVDDPRSILDLYTLDLRYLIYPGVHHDAAGYTFTNLSYYDTSAQPGAWATDANGVSITVVTMGLVRQLAGLAAAVWRAAVPILFDEQPVPGPADELDLTALITQRQLVDEPTFLRIIESYPRFVAGGSQPIESEYMLFADMLRFIWAHEWVHGFAGHARAVRTELGITRLQEFGGDALDAETAAVIRAFEFEADCISLRFNIEQMLGGWDMPGRVVTFRGGIEARLATFVLAVSTVITHWAAMEYESHSRDPIHPAPEVRFLRTWETVADIAFDRGLERTIDALSAGIATTMFEMADVCGHFGLVRGVVPGPFTTPTMERCYAEMEAFHHTIVSLDHALVRHEIDGAAGDCTNVIVDHSIW